MKRAEVNYQKIIGEIVKFLRNEFKKRNKDKAIVGISGGIDSAVTACLCKKAELDLYGVLMPYKKRGLKQAKEMVKTLNLSKDKVIYLNITSLVDTQIREIRQIIKLDKISTENILPRQRMVVQYAVAHYLNGLVVGTQNLSEHYLGYFTLYGDQSCDICPIAGLWKTQIYQLAKYLNIPKSIIKKEPSGDLWPGITDEKDLGFKYKDADKILYLFLVRRNSKKKIISEYGFTPKLVNRVLERARITSYKREKVPVCYFKK